MKTKHLISPELQILECTLRDGSYAVDFRFTDKDTSSLCGVLSRLGFKFIEIGHGLGINAVNAGKGKMPSSDRTLLESAKSSVKDSKIGMFCIPGIASPMHIEEMARSGLDFIRIGNDADNIEKAYPLIKIARKNNIYTMLNFMKSYTISPREFAQKAKEAVEEGAEVIYLVDSAGGMLPEEVVRYIEEVKAAVDVKIGIHTHNNLHLATANAMEAVKNGINFVDTTLYGIGRSAGNAPTEVVVAILKNMGIDLKIDFFELMDVADKYFAPLMEKINMYNMLSVTMGAGKFHSGFLPQATRVAQEYKADLRKLIYHMGKKNPARIDVEEMKKVAWSLRETSPSTHGHDMLSFDSLKVGKEIISNTVESVSNLLEGLINASAKGRKKIVIEITPTSSADDKFILAEYVTSDQDMVMGRIHFGSMEILETVLRLIKDHVSFIMISGINVDWTSKDNIHNFVGQYINKQCIIPAQDMAVIGEDYLIEALRLSAFYFGKESLLVYGGDPDFYQCIKRCSAEFDNIFWFQRNRPAHFEGDRIVILDNLKDWEELNLKFDIILCVSNPSENDIKMFLRSLKNSGKIIILGAMPALTGEENQDNQIFNLNMNNAYQGVIHRWLQFNNSFLEKVYAKV